MSEFSDFEGMGLVGYPNDAFLSETMVTQFSRYESFEGVPFVHFYALDGNTQGNEWYSIEDSFLLADYDIPRAQPKISTVSLPGSNDILDFSEQLGGRVAYENREITLTLKKFYAQFLEYREERARTRQEIFNEIVAKIHGKKMAFQIFPQSLGHAMEYRGRVMVVSDDVSNNISDIFIRVIAEPFWYEPYDELQTFSVEGGQWNTVFFEPMEVLPKKPTAPNIWCEVPMYLKISEYVDEEYSEKIYKLQQGDNHVLDIIIDENYMNSPFEFFPITENQKTWEDMSSVSFGVFDEKPIFEWQNDGVEGSYFVMIEFERGYL